MDDRENLLTLQEPSMENLHTLLELHRDQLQELKTLIDGTETDELEFKRTLTFLLLSTLLNVTCISDWFDEQKWPMQLVAWSARNLFELEVWTRFVLRSRANADRFANDWIIDGIGILEGIDSWSQSGNAPVSGVDSTLENLRRLKREKLPPGARFLQLRDVVADVGMEQEYRQLNGVFSKLVHPTSWSVFCTMELLDRSNMRGFVVARGVTSSNRLVGAIREHVASYGLKPL